MFTRPSLWERRLIILCEGPSFADNCAWLLFNHFLQQKVSLTSVCLWDLFHFPWNVWFSFVPHVRWQFLGLQHHSFILLFLLHQVFFFARSIKRLKLQFFHTSLSSVLNKQFSKIWTTNCIKSIYIARRYKLPKIIRENPKKNKTFDSSWYL